MYLFFSFSLIISSIIKISKLSFDLFIILFFSLFFEIIFFTSVFSSSSSPSILFFSLFFGMVFFTSVFSSSPSSPSTSLVSLSWNSIAFFVFKVNDKKLLFIIICPFPLISFKYLISDLSNVVPLYNSSDNSSSNLGL